jgi:hypothetical protein
MVLELVKSRSDFCKNDRNSFHVSYKTKKYQISQEERQVFTRHIRINMRLLSIKDKFNETN